MYVTEFRKMPKGNIKGGKMVIGFINSKAEKAYHWGVKTAFIIEKSFPFWGIVLCHTFCFVWKGKSKCGCWNEMESTSLAWDAEAGG